MNLHTLTHRTAVRFVFNARLGVYPLLPISHKPRVLRTVTLNHWDHPLTNFPRPCLWPVPDASSALRLQQVIEYNLDREIRYYGSVRCTWMVFRLVYARRGKCEQYGVQQEDVLTKATGPLLLRYQTTVNDIYLNYKTTMVTQ